MMHLAEWRETEAQRRDLPRNRILRDETILDLAGTNPSTTAEFGKIRNFPGGATASLRRPSSPCFARSRRCPTAPFPIVFRKAARRNRRPPSWNFFASCSSTSRIRGMPRDSSLRPTSSRRCTRRRGPGQGAERMAARGVGDVALRLKHGKIALAADGKRVRVIEL